MQFVITIAVLFVSILGIVGAARSEKNVREGNMLCLTR